MKLSENGKNSSKNIQLLFLIAAGIVIYPLIVVDCLFPGYGAYIRQQYMIVPCLLFFGSAVSRQLTPLARKVILLSVAMVAWFVVAQTQHWLAGMGSRSFGIFIVGYLLALPFASVTEDASGDGLKWIGRFYVAYSLVMVVLAGILLLDVVPAALAAHVKWDGARLSVFAHPNGGGCILMLGVCFSVYFLTRAETKGRKWTWGVLTALQFGGLALTNSRTSILLSCALIAGTLFFSVWDGSWKRFLAGAAAALAVILVLFSLAGTLYDLHSQAQINKLIRQYMEQPEGAFTEQQKLVYGENGEICIAGSDTAKQGELLADAGTLNGRTEIWQAAFSTLEDNPGIRIWGTENYSAEISYRNRFPAVNAHNSWIQVTLLLGIPGGLLALLYTLIAVWNLWKVMWRKQEDISRKVVAMMVICLLAASILEAYLFDGDTIFTKLLFFLCTGYLMLWNAEAK